MAKGRLCRKWGEAQGQYYAMHPDLRTKKWCTSQIWMRRMIGALLDMSLAMWKNRCDCLHGHSKSEQAVKRKEKIKDKIFWWYNNRRSIPESGQYLFRIEETKFIESRSPQYLEKWIDTVEAMKTQATTIMDSIIRVPHNTAHSDSNSVDTRSTSGLDDYLVDINDGIDLEDTMADAGCCIDMEYAQEEGSIHHISQDSLVAAHDEDDDTDDGLQVVRDEVVEESSRVETTVETRVNNGKELCEGNKVVRDGTGKHGSLAVPLARKPPWNHT